MKNIFVSIFITLASYSFPAAATENVDPLLAHQIRTAVALANPSTAKNNQFLANLAEVYVSLQVGLGLIDTCEILLNPLTAGINLLSGFSLSSARLAQTVNSTETARFTAYRGIAADVAMQSLNLVAFNVGQQYRGQVPLEIRNQFAFAAERIGRTMSDWQPSYAVTVISENSSRRFDGFELVRWNTQQMQNYLANPLQFLADEIHHTKYIFGEHFFRHNLEHRVSGLRALLDGRPTDALSLQFVGDLDLSRLSDH